MAMDSNAVMSTVEKLRAILEREPALRGDELEKAVVEKEALISQLGQELRLGEAGDGERVAQLEKVMAPLSFANGLALQLNRMRLQLSRLQKNREPAESTPRVDLIS